METLVKFFQWFSDPNMKCGPFTMVYSVLYEVAPNYFSTPAILRVTPVVSLKWRVYCYNPLGQNLDGFFTFIITTIKRDIEKFLW